MAIVDNNQVHGLPVKGKHRDTDLQSRRYAALQAHQSTLEKCASPTPGSTPTSSQLRECRGGEAHLMRSSTKSMVVPMTCISAAGSIRMRTPRSSTTSSNFPFSSAHAGRWEMCNWLAHRPRLAAAPSATDFATAEESRHRDRAAVTHPSANPRCSSSWDHPMHDSPPAAADSWSGPACGAQHEATHLRSSAYTTARCTHAA